MRAGERRKWKKMGENGKRQKGEETTVPVSFPSPTIASAVSESHQTEHGEIWTDCNKQPPLLFLSLACGADFL